MRLVGVHFPRSLFTSNPPSRPTRILALPPSPMPGASAKERKQELDGISARLAAKFSDVQHVSPDAVAALQREGCPVVLIDARTPEERAVSTIPGSLTVEQFEAREGELRGARCVAFCTIGYRSSQLAQGLRKRGFDAANLEGSILAWTHAGLPLVTKQGGEEVVTNRVHVFAERWALQGEGYEAVTFKHGLFSYAASMASSFASKLFRRPPSGA